jgi:hypothetical protein
MGMEIKVEEVNPDGTKREIELDQAAQGYHNFLVMFNSIIDLDFAVLRMIQAEYNNPKYIDQSVMSMTVKEVKSALLNREDPNPLTICIKDKEVAVSIYQEIMSTRYGDLLKEDKYLTITGIFFMLSVYETQENTHINIVCGNELEKEIVRKYHKNVNIIEPNALSDIDVNSYTEFIFKNWKDILKFNKQFNEKRVLLLNYKFNTTIQDGVVYPKADIAFWLWDTGFSTVALMDTYSKNEDDYVTLRVKRVKKKSGNK